MPALRRFDGRTGVLPLAVFVLLALGTAPAAGLDPHKAVPYYLLDRWNESLGLPQNNVKVIHQTGDGYLWIGTKGGLVRFDGVRFVVYDDRRPNQLEEGEVWALVEDDDNALWIGTYGGGVTRLKDGTFTTLRAAPGGLPSDFVTSLARSADGSLWIGTEKGLCRLKDGRVTPFDGQDGLPSANVRALHLDRTGVLWIGTSAGLASYASGRVDSHAGRLQGRLDRRIAALVGDPSGALWIGTSGAGLVRMQGERLSTYSSRDGLPNETVNALSVDAHGALWVGTNEGLCRFREERCEAYAPESASHGTTEPLGTSPLRDIQALAFDREGSLWIGTAPDGLARLRDGMFEHLGRREGLPNDNVRTVYQDASGAMWVGTESGAARIVGGRIQVFTEASGLSDDGITMLSGEADGTVWIGTANGLHRFREGRIEHVRGGGLDRLGIPGIMPDPQGGVWIAASNGGLYRYRDGTVTRLDSEQAPLGERVRALALDARGRLWIGTRDGGLTRLEGRRFVTVPLEEGGRPPSVHALFADGAEAMWVATRHGLKRIKGDKAVTLTTREGLAANFAYAFVDDGRGDLWMPYSSGIMRVSKRELNAVADGVATSVACVSYGTAHGLKSTAMAAGRQNAAFRSRDGRLWFATGGGVAMVDPLRIPVNDLAPPVRIEEVSVDGKARGLPDRAEFGPGRGQVEIRYTALTFLAPERVRFRRMLEGFDRQWVEAGPQRVAYYTNLPPGRYRFRVNACNKDGVWNESGAAYSFRLLPRWYQTALARALGALAVVLAVWGAHRWRVRRLEARERELAARVQERTHDLAQEVDEHRSTAAQLQAEAQERERIQRDLERLNQELGQRVVQRSAELAAATEDVSAEKERLVVTLRSIGDGVIATSLHGAVVLLNRVAEDLTGWTHKDAVGRHITEVFRIVERWKRSPLPDPVAAAIRDQRTVDLSGPALLLARDGQERLIADSVAPIRDRMSRITGAVLVFRDVTDRIRLDEHLAEVQKLESLRVLAAGIAHDFNNLLAGLFGYIDLARLDSPEDSAVRRRLTKALDVLKRARGLSGQLLTFSGGSTPVTAPTDVGNLLREGARFALAGSNVTSEMAIAEDLWPCQVDATQIGQVVDNLLINARQAMPEGGRVDVRAENVVLSADPILPPGRYVRITLRDHGLGIAPEHRGRVFDPFFTTKAGGTGLGLATTHAILEKHRGHVEFDSVVGEGTSFRVLLPAAPAGDSATSEVVSRLGAVHGRVLVMDDEPVVREVLEEALGALDMRVATVADGQAAIDACRAALEAEDPFDLVVLDLTIPGGIGGIETVARIREVQPAVRAIATSGYSSDPVMAEPARFGFQATLAKPYLIADVHRVVSALLTRDAAAPPDPRDK